MQYKEVTGGICAPKGFAAAGVHCGIRANHSEKYDLALIKADVRCAAAGVYTTNKVCGAPIKVDRAHLADGYAQAIVVNSGNANTCAANGVALAEECCELVGKELGIDPQDVLPASTGVIGQPMVIDPFAFLKAIQRTCQNINNQFIRQQLALIDISFGCLSQFCTLLNLSTKHIPC
jgi:glutamate N-acetyltransferase/amino-acid N-acetyltransferase